LFANVANGVDETDRFTFGPLRQIDDAWRGQHRSDLADDSATRLFDPALTIDSLGFVLVVESGLDDFRQRRLIAVDR